MDQLSAFNNMGGSNDEFHGRNWRRMRLLHRKGHRARHRRRGAARASRRMLNGKNRVTQNNFDFCPKSPPNNLDFCPI